MLSCISRRSRGQALVEAAIVLPLGLLLLLAVGYVGRGLIERQSMLVAARYAAREASLAAMRSPVYKASGAGVLQEAATPADRQQSAQQASHRQAEVHPPDWSPALTTQSQLLHPLPLGPYGMAFVARSAPQTLDGMPMQFGLGLVLYGAKISERVSFLEPIRKDANAVAGQYSHQGGPLLNPLVVSGSAFMPGEAPVHAPGVGLLDTNKWIVDIVERKR